MQSIKLLQMTHVELEQFLDIEIEKIRCWIELRQRMMIFRALNPHEIVLKPAERMRRRMTCRMATGSKQALRIMPKISHPPSTVLENIFPDDPGRFDEIGPDLAAQWKSSVGDGYVSGGSYDIDQVTASRISLSEHVAEQIALTFSKAADRFIATALADALDESGYLRVDIVGLAQNLGVETVEIERVLGVMQGFDPAGLLPVICGSV